MTTGTIFWDFDGTLAHRPGSWRSALQDALEEHDPDHGLVAGDLRDQLQDGFPWHTPDVAHPELNEPSAWWDYMHARLSRVYTTFGYDPAPALAMAQRARVLYTDPSSYVVYPEVPAVLGRLRDDGWRHVILSNHVPELQTMVEGLALAPYFDRVLTSGLLGYEKPHPRLFEIAREGTPAAAPVWMVGDSPRADVAGAEAVGIPAILVRGGDGTAPRRADDLHEVRRWIVAGPGASAPAPAD